MKKDFSNSYTGFEIAVIGMSGRFPGAKNIDEFWANLKNNREAITFLSPGELRKAGISPELPGNKNHVKACGIIDNIEYFDASFFGYSHKEAEIMNPQTRIFYECVYDALEDAGYASGDYNGIIGVYAGASINHNWEAMLLLSGKNDELGQMASTTLANKDSLSTRISFKLNLKGPSISLRTACSTSLVAIHTASRALLTRECDTALAGGVSIQNLEKRGYLYQEGLITSPDGHCRPFDARANGTIFTDGAGVAALKKLKNALQDGDNIYAVIKGSAINNDGCRKVGYTAPSVEGQADVILSAQKMAGVHPDSIGYVETHGTATNTGDTIEIEALKSAFKTGKKNYCCLGFVKSNIGHLDAAAGVASFIKTVLVLKHKLIPPGLHFETPNPEIDLENSPFYINRELKEWKAHHYPLRAGVSSFGLGGTNAHVILEEAPEIEHGAIEERTGRPYRLLLLSAKKEAVLQQITQNLLDHFKKNPQVNLSSAAYTLQVGRGHFKYRKWLVCSTMEEAVDALANQGGERVHPGIYDNENRPVIFLFSGLGSQYINMGVELYQNEPVFRDEMNRCFDILNTLVDYDIKEILYPSPVFNRSNRSNKSYIPNIQRPEFSQPIVFIFEYALAALLMKWGIKPHAMIGYSFGEYAAACISGIFSLEDALKLVVSRSKLIQKMPGGVMLSVPLPMEELLPFINCDLSIAIDNGPSCIVAGSEEVVISFEKQMKERKILCVPVPAARAIHSKMMEPILKEFERVIAQFILNKPQIPFISNVTGTWMDEREVVKPTYWGKHLTHTVQFARGMKELVKEDKAVFIVIGPGQDLRALISRYIDKEADQKIVNLVRQPQKNIPDNYFLLNQIGRLWLYGVKVDWDQFYGEEKRFRISLPTYPYERQRYWFEYSLSGIDSSFMGKRSPLNDKKNFFYTPSWKPAALPPYLPGNNSSHFGSCRLMFIDESNFTSQIVKQLKRQGETVFCVKEDAGFKKIDDFNYTINPRLTENYDMLLCDLQTRGITIRTIAHLWNITKICDQELEFKQVKHAQEIGLYSLLHLARAIGSQWQNDENPVQIKVITNNMQRLPGEEFFSPEKAPLLAAVRMIPHYYPNIKLANIDISIPGSGIWQETRLTSQLLSELRYEYSGPVVVYRGNDRLVHAYEPLKLKNFGKAAPALKDGGVYLITGGLEGKGFEIAQYIAAAARSRLIFIKDPVFPPTCPPHSTRLTETGNNCPDEEIQCYPGKLKEENRFQIDLNQQVDFLSQVERKIEKELELKELDSFEGLEETLNRLCSGYILDYLGKNSIKIEPGRVYEKKDLKRKLRILPKFDKFYDFFIRVLSEDNLIRAAEDNIEFLRGAVEVGNPRLLSKEAREKYPGFRGTLGLLEHCTAHYSEALSGEIEPVGVLYPNGNYIKCEDKHIDPVNYSKEELYIQVLRELLSKVIREAQPGRTVRILEIGAGQGILTGELIPILRNQDIEYHFTDIGNFFVVNAKKEAARQGLNFMKFKTFDISKDPVEEGYELFSFDIILGLNVVHMVKFIKEALRNLKQLLAPNGIIGLIEITEPKRWRHLINGLAEGWWFFEDSDLRKDTSLLSLHTWETVFKEVEFQDVYSFPLDHQRKFKTNCGLIVGQQPGRIKDKDWPVKVHDNQNQFTGDEIRNVKRLEGLGARVRVMTAEAGNPGQVQKTVTGIMKEFGRIDGVIHCYRATGAADETGDSSPEPVARILEPAVKNLLVLDNAFKNNPPDFFVICSILHMVDIQQNAIGNCAAVDFFNFFAQYRLSGFGQVIMSINWYPGAEVTIDNVFGFIHQHSFGQLILSPGEPMDASAPTGEYDKKDVESTDHAAVKKYQRSELSSAYMAPGNRIEKVLTDIWEEFLDIEQVGIDDDFLELGADSLVFITIGSKIHKALNVDIPITEFFNTPTVAGIANYILESQNRENFEPLFPAEKKEYYPLSPAQVRLYFMYLLNKSGTAYNVPTLVWLEGEIEKERLEEAFKKLIARHESLRSSIVMLENNAVQKIHRTAEISIQYYKSKDPVETERIVRNFICSFDLSVPPLLRAALVKEKQNRHLLMVDSHHIAADGYSIEILKHQFMELYKGEELPGLNLHYKDFSQWQIRLLNSGAIKKQEEYWINQFKDNIPALKLPADYPGAHGAISKEDDSLALVIDKDITIRINEILKKTGTTMFMFLLAVYNVLLNKYSGQEDIVVGCPVSGRKHNDLQYIIGMFVNMLAIRNQVEGNKTFKEFLEELKKNALDAYENQDYQFDQLIKKLGLQGGPSGNPLFEVVLSMFNPDILQEKSDKHIDNKIKLFPYKDSNIIRIPFDLIFTAVENYDHIQLEIRYVTSLYKKTRIQKMGKHFVEIIIKVLEDKNIKLKDISLSHSLTTVNKITPLEEEGDFLFQA